MKEVLLELEESQLVCDKCSGKMKPTGKKFVRHELEIIPKQVILKAIYAVTYACAAFCGRERPLVRRPTAVLYRRM